jgi:hypothetical protein
MLQFIPTVVIGTILALAAAVVVLLYWLMIVLFRALQLVTLPLHIFRRADRA